MLFAQLDPNSALAGAKDHGPVTYILVLILVIIFFLSMTWILKVALPSKDRADRESESRIEEQRRLTNEQIAFIHGMNTVIGGLDDSLKSVKNELKDQGSHINRIASETISHEVLEKTHDRVVCLLEASHVAADYVERADFSEQASVLAATRMRDCLNRSGMS